MYYTLGIPAEAKRRVTFDTILREAGYYVIRVMGSNEIVSVTLDAFVSKPIEDKTAFHGMTFHTAYVAMGTYEWKSVLFVKFWNIEYQPAFGSMTAHTVVAHTSAVHIGMAGKTICRRIIEYQVTVTRFTIHHAVGAFQFKTGCLMVESHSGRIQFPATGVMALSTIYPQSITVRRLCVTQLNGAEQHYYK